MFALLFLGGLGLAAAVLLALLSPRGLGTGFWGGIAVAFVVWAVGLVAFAWQRAWFIDRAHIIAAVSLAACVLVVVYLNGILAGGAWSIWYKVIAAAMLGFTLVLAILWEGGAITLFWVEIVVAAFFVLFWIVQTVERARAPVSPRESAS